MPSATKPGSPLHALPLLGMSLRQRLNFYQQLNSQLHSGIPLAEALDFLVRNTFPFFRPVARELADHVQRGGMLSGAMRRYPNLFAAWECGVVRAGEESGDLPDAMANIAETLELEHQLREKLNMSTLHLKFTAGFLVVVAFALHDVRGGRVSDVMSAMNVLGNSLLTALGFLAAVILLWQLFRIIGRTRVGAEIIDAVLARLPILGPVLHEMCRQRFIRAMQSLWKAGVGPMHLLNCAADASGSALIKHRAAEHLDRLKHGDMLHKVIGDMRILPEETVYMLSVGETTGRISEALASVADYIRMELNQKIFAMPQKVLTLFYAIVVIMVIITISSMLAGYGG